MKKNVNIITTGVLIAGLIVPNAMQANGFIDNFLAWFGTTAGATAGHRIGAAIGEGVAHHGTEMIPVRLRKPLVAVAAIGLVAYVIYEYNKDSDQNSSRKNRRANSCGKKGCGHKGCK